MFSLGGVFKTAVLGGAALWATHVGMAGLAKSVGFYDSTLGNPSDFVSKLFKWGGEALGLKPDLVAGMTVPAGSADVLAQDTGGIRNRLANLFASKPPFIDNAPAFDIG